MFFKLIVTFFVALISSTVFANSDTTHALHSRNILIVGDSEACAVGVVAKSVAKEYGLSDKVNVECKTGTTINYWTNGNFDRALAKYPNTEIVLVFLGTNHYSSIVPPKTSNLLTNVKNRNLQCIWVGPVAVKGQVWPINDFLSQSVSETCTYFDSSDIELRDGVHPTTDSAKKWLNQIWNLIPFKRTIHLNNA